MRLLLTTDTVGGVWEYSLTLARALEREGHAPLLAVIGDPSEEQLAEVPDGIALECRDDRLEWLLASREELAGTAEWLAGLAREWRAELVHLNQMAYPALATFTAPTVVAVHSDACSWFAEVRNSAPPPDWREYQAVVGAGLAAADTVVTPSRYQSGLIERHFGRCADAVIHNGAGVSTSVPVRRQPMSLLSAGRAWDEAKGISILDRALAILGTGAPPADLLGGLEGPNGTRYEPALLSCHGQVGAAEVRRRMSTASVYVAPSLYEPFGLSPLEAALRGCALVMSDIGSFRELWDGCAVFFQKGSALSLARTIESLMSRPERVRSLAQQARERALARYTIDHFVVQYLELYQTTFRSTFNQRPLVKERRAAVHQSHS